MRLVRFDDAGKTRLGVVRDSEIIPLDTLEARYPTMLSIVAGGGDALREIAVIRDAGADALPLDQATLLAPIERPGKYLAIGMNYRKHIEEAKKLGVDTPKNQFWFNKQTSCITGPFADTDPGVSAALDYEVELGVVIGKPAKGASRDQARDHVFGYLVCNDVSARDWQQHSPTFTVGKSFDTHGPIGPWIVTADEIADPHTLRLRCYVNGELRQDGNTDQLVYDIWDQISYLSTAFTLESGDLIATGTPNGVGAAMSPPSFLQPGDVVRCEIDGVGVIENRVVANAAH
ncbi:fumarylacetoacetate hydrolase family protein [Sphingosinithalassobacter portus]|uniref:fumarylacetoacetate hydrolase family protein n=1 Tax=Stakelama portus TaxID=2676234 RepID=UPI000D6E05EE|nr:fumarylacetoacetate hydrolase family protein [Sphingosinithalassobacter portus]